MRKFTVNFACFGYADVIKYQEKPTISCERADFYSSRHQRARGHKTLGSHLNFGAYGFKDVRACRVFASCLVPLSQSEASCKTFHMKVSFIRM